MSEGRFLFGHTFSLFEDYCLVCGRSKADIDWTSTALELCPLHPGNHNIEVEPA